RTRLREKSRTEASEEAYWRGRARDLRTEIASVDAGINYVRARLNELNETSLANKTIVTGVYPLWPNDRPYGYGRGRNGRWGRIPPAIPFPNGYPTAPNGYPNGGNGYPNPPF